MKRAGQVLAVGVVVAMFGLLAWRLVDKAEGGAASALREGKLVDAPGFTLPRLDRPGELSLASLRGKVVVINFWASWCEPCKEEAPDLERASRAYRSRGVVVLGVDARDFKGDARRFMRKYGLTYPIVHDGKGSTLADYELTGFPETFIVGRDGRLLEHFAGAVSAQELRSGIERALARR